MPDYIVDNDSCYCSLCDQYFTTEESRTAHIQYSPNHPRCETCNTRFANGNSLRVVRTLPTPSNTKHHPYQRLSLQHYTVSRRHNYCSGCFRHFNTAAGIRAVCVISPCAHGDCTDAHMQHIELVHGGDDSDSDDDDDPARSYDGWEDDVGREMFPDEDDLGDIPVSHDEVIAPEDDYWPEDTEPLPDELRELEEEEDQSYNGWGPVPSHEDLGNQSDDESDDVRSLLSLTRIIYKTNASHRRPMMIRTLRSPRVQSRLSLAGGSLSTAPSVCVPPAHPLPPYAGTSSALRKSLSTFFSVSCH